MFADLKKLCMGASNIKRNKKLLHQELSNCEFILTYTFDELKKEIQWIDFKMFDIIFIHILTNDISHICWPKRPKYLKSNSEKEEELHAFIHDFNSFIMKLAANWPNVQFCISLCLPRFDHRDQLGMLSGRELVNQNIYNSLHHKNNITLVWNENFGIRDYVGDFFHLTPTSFLKLMSNWKSAIGKLLYNFSIFSSLCKI